ncbi:MAG: tetratricopeptide repeat protein, partial [Chthoniobacteraceae bacterium]
RGAYESAAAEYEKYLGLYPNGPHKQTVLFRLGESYRRRGINNAARSSYQALLDQFVSGQFIGPASYRLAEIYFDERDYASALPYYRKASVRLQDQKLANAAKFFVGRCHENLDQKRDARMVYEDLVATPENNPFIDNSRLSYAMLLRDEGRVAPALKQIDVLKKSTENPELKAQATVYAGLWSIELGDNQRGAAELEAALKMQESARWREVALLGLIQISFNKGNYDDVIQKWQEEGNDFSPETRPRVMILAAKAYRSLKKPEESAALFDQLAKQYSGSTYAKEAGYERLVNLYRADDPAVLEAIDVYLNENPSDPKRDQVVLMKAEALFKKEQYAAAAPLYEEVSKSRRLTAVMKAETLRKLGWCYLESRDNERAVKTYTALVEGYPTFEGIPAAYLQRAVAFMRMNNLEGAVKDFRQLVDRYPKAKERELALLQLARLLGQQGDNMGMVQTFKIYLRERPDAKGAGAAEAYYWIGSVAFESKDYKNAVEPLRQARENNPAEHFEQISQRLMASHYYLEDKEGCAREVDAYLSGDEKGQVPYEVLNWLGLGYFKAAGDATAAGQTEEAATNQRAALKYLGMLIARGDAKPADLRAYGASALALQESDEAIAAYQKLIDAAQEPIRKAEGYNGLAQACIELRKFAEAQKAVDAGIALQPEGPVNATLRTSAADILAAQQNWLEAAKLYESVTVIIDDENLSPRAGEKAVAAYQKAGEEEVAAKLLNKLQSRYPEYFQNKKARLSKAGRE